MIPTREIDPSSQQQLLQFWCVLICTAEAQLSLQQCRQFVEEENSDSWTWFLNDLKHAIPQIMTAMIMSDRDKCVINGKTILGEGIVQAHSCFHMCQNLKAKFGTRLTQQHFWGIANARSEAVYTPRLLDLDVQRSEAASAKVHICPLYLMRHVRDGGQNYQTPVDVWVIHTLINLG